MRPYLTATLAILSALAAILLTILFITSFHHLSYYPLKLGPFAMLFRSSRGLVSITAFDAVDWLPRYAQVAWQYSLAGFGLQKNLASSPYYTLFLPHWFLILLLVIYPIYWFRHTTFYFSRRNQRLALGQCPTCAYDLRMHHPGNKCPECGTPVSPR